MEHQDPANMIASTTVGGFSRQLSQDPSLPRTTGVSSVQVRQVYDASSFHRCRVRHLGDVWWNHCVEVEDRRTEPRGEVVPSQMQDAIVVDKGLGLGFPTKNPKKVTVTG